MAVPERNGSFADSSPGELYGKAATVTALELIERDAGVEIGWLRSR